MEKLKALKKQLKEDIITYDCIDYIVGAERRRILHKKK